MLFRSGESSPRTPVVATIKALPPEPSTIPGSSCGGIPVASRAIGETEGIFRWYAAPTGGTALQTSLKSQFDSFTPDPLPNVTTDYYVSITDDITGCESARTSVRFSINGDPAIVPTVTPAARCGAGTVTLSASATVPGTFRWYDKSDNSGLLMGSNATFATPDITQSTDFYVTFTDQGRGCVSAIQAVTATVSSPPLDRKSTRLNSSHSSVSRMPSSA